MHIGCQGEKKKQKTKIALSPAAAQEVPGCDLQTDCLALGA
jgi:hypothetical protein